MSLWWDVSLSTTDSVSGEPTIAQTSWATFFSKLFLCSQLGHRSLQELIHSELKLKRMSIEFLQILLLIVHPIKGITYHWIDMSLWFTGAASVRVCVGRKESLWFDLTRDSPPPNTCHPVIMPLWLLTRGYLQSPSSLQQWLLLLVQWHYIVPGSVMGWGDQSWAEETGLRLTVSSTAQLLLAGHRCIRSGRLPHIDYSPSWWCGLTCLPSHQYRPSRKYLENARIF